MFAWVVERPRPIDEGPLRLVERPVPEPGPGQIRVKVLACGVCRTDLHLAEGDLPPRHAHVTPGHEVVGVVDALGQGASRFRPGDRAGIAWLAGTCGHCRFCRDKRENLCLSPRFTGWDVDGGFAEYAVADELFAYPLPPGYRDRDAAPLLCAGIIGYRALRRAGVPGAGRLGIYGFGASAHIAAQVALHDGTEVHVFTRSAQARALALSLGAASANAPDHRPSPPMSSAVLFAPAGELVPLALEAVDRGGTVAIAGVYLSDIPAMSYETHLFQERNLTSVTANTREDGEQLLSIAAGTDLDITTTPYRFEQVPEALSDLAHGRVRGAGVVMPTSPRGLRS